MSILFSSLLLANGTRLPNRLVKAAMEENLADAKFAPATALIQLYQRWAAGGVGLLISGNVMVDRTAMTGPAGVVLDAEQDLAPFQTWARTGRAHGAGFWLQLNHPGRQMPGNLQQPTYAPSAIALELGRFSKHFRPPLALTEAHIHRIIQQFVTAAVRAEQAGFTGVQIHAAHGYLLSQFLSPRTNQRTDDWGGSLANRARILLEIVQQVRRAVSPCFTVAVKLNSADFQRGGFDVKDAMQVVQWLNPLGVDVVELSGGSYEAPAMQGQARDGQTLAREAYFFEFAKQIQTVAQMPLLLTGGVRRFDVAEQVLTGGIALVGMATALAMSPDLPTIWRQQPSFVPALPVVNIRSKPLASMAMMAFVKYQLRRLSRQQLAKPSVSAWWALVQQQWLNWRLSRRYRRLLSRIPR